MPIYTPVQIAGFIQQGLAASVRNTGNYGGLTAPTLNQCESKTTSAIAMLRYGANFGTAFKIRGAAGQNIPGNIYNTESGFVPAAGTLLGLTGSNSALNSTAGLADYGTRLKAVFNSVPTGVRIFVSTTNIINLTGTSSTGGTPTSAVAQLVISDTALGLSTVPASGFTTVSGIPTPLVYYAEIQVVNNSASAVWEVTSNNTSTPTNFDFGVFITYIASAGTNSPPPGTATVNMSYAPIPATNTFTATAGSQASSILTLPRFYDSSGSGNNLFTIATCTTSLLFPFVTSQVGFDTGIAIMNTSSDPFGTKAQAGTCDMWFYGQNAPPKYTTPSIAAGNPDPTKYAFQASVIAPNFEGYMIAICNFQMAHGYAFISDLGAHNLAHGYLALVLTLTNPLTTSGRGAANPEILEN